MKNFLSKLKGLNYKQVVIEHGEKGIFGLIGLFVLGSLGGTSWSRYDKTPGGFVDKVVQGRKNIQASAWTQERSQPFANARGISDDVQKLHSPLDVSLFDYKTDWYWPMYPQQERVKEPKWFQPSEAIADVGRFIMVENPIDESNLTTGIIEGADAKSKTEENPDDDNAPRRSKDDNSPRVPGAGVGPGVGPGAPGAIGKPPGVGPKVGGLPGGEGIANYGGGDSMYGGGGSTANVNARGIRFVSIRSLFPLKDQVDEFIKTMHDSQDIASSRVQFVDFELERQVMIAGKNPWSGPWEKVEIQSALDVLDRVEFDPEVVDVAYTDPVFTMPLPRRVAGKWTTRNLASHPKIKQLDELNQKVQEELMKKAIEENETMQKEDKTRPRGFAEKQHNSRGIRNDVRGSGKINNFSKDVGSSMMESGGYQMGGQEMGQVRGAVNSMANQFQNTDTRTMKYLLFRYFDFSVEPGNSYRYRMRLTLMNPNFKRAVEDLVDDSIAAGEVRKTPWSDPTTPVSIPEEQQIYLSKVTKARADGTLPNAAVDVYQWFAEAGTYIAAKLEPLQLGQHVAGPTKTQVLRPANETLKDESVSIYTGNVLTDIAAAPISELDPIEHADLKVDPKKLKQIGTVDRVLMVDKFGQLVALDPKTTSDDQAASQRNLDSERKPWEYLKEKEQATATGNDLDKLRRAGGGGGAGTAGEGLGMMPGMGGMGMGKGGSVLKKSGGKSAVKKGKGGANAVDSYKVGT